MPTHLDCDVVVIGGGPIGLAAAYHCAKAGRKVLVLERFNFFNQSGSSNDLVRMFRTMYTQDFMADLAAQSITLWRDLEREAGEALILMSGLLNFGDPAYHDGPEGNLTDPIKNLDRLKMSYRLLSAKQIMQEYPFKNLPSSFRGVFAPDNGCINVPQVLRSLHWLAGGYGARLVPRARVHGLAVRDDSVTIEGDIGGTTTTSVTAHRCILAAGAYTNHILASVGVGILLNIWEMVYEYYATAAGPGGTVFPSMWFQFLDPSGEPARSNLFYGFPAVPWAPPNLARIAVDDATNLIADPNQRKITPSEHDLAITSDFVRDHCVGVDARPNFSGTCLQSNVVDNMFVLDTLPASVGAGHRNVVLFTAGWGFKFVPLIGRILGELVLKGETSYDISRFAITRPGVLSPLPPQARKTDARAFCRAPF
jgi:sarcosine oxidase/L-pipecolate oxidase